MKRLMIALLAAEFVLGCGTGRSTDSANLGAPPAADPASPAVGLPDLNGVVVKARASFTYSTSQEMALARASRDLMNLLLAPAMAANPSTQAVSVVLAPNVSMSMSNAAFAPPSITNAVLDFGKLSITALSDNALNACGSGGNSHCGTALFRVYTTGTARAGFYNSVDNFGAPMTVQLAGRNGELNVGLGTAGAAIVTTETIPSNKHVIKLSDFSPAPIFQIRGDFTDAGAGTYATTINVEFALAP